MTSKTEEIVSTIILGFVICGIVIMGLYVLRWLLLIFSVAYVLFYFFIIKSYSDFYNFLKETFSKEITFEKFWNIMLIISISLFVIIILLFKSQLWFDLNYFYSVVKNWIINLF